MTEDYPFDEQTCPGHIASESDPKVCGRCGTHIDSLRPSSDQIGVHIDSSEVRPQDKPPRPDGKCQYCGGETQQGFGLAGRGFGPYSYCETCSRVVDKCDLGDGA